MVKSQRVLIRMSNSESSKHHTCEDSSFEFDKENTKRYMVELYIKYKYIYIYIYNIVYIIKHNYGFIMFINI